MLIASAAFLGALGVLFVLLRSDQRHFVPCGYRGPVVIVYGHPNGVSIERSLLGTYRFRIEDSGLLRARSSPPWEPLFRIRVFETCDAQTQELHAAAIQVGSVALAEWTETVNEREWHFADSSKDPQLLWSSYIVVEHEDDVDADFLEEREILLAPALEEAQESILRDRRESEHAR